MGLSFRRESCLCMDYLSRAFAPDDDLFTPVISWSSVSLVLIDTF